MDCYRDGFNLAKRKIKYKDAHLLFLYDSDVPYDNNICERLARTYKRKQQQVITFRSGVNLDYICSTIGVLETWRLQNCNLFESAEEVFRRQTFRKSAKTKSKQNKQQGRIIPLLIYRVYLYLPVNSNDAS